MPMLRRESAVPSAVALKVASGSQDLGPWPELASLPSLKSRRLLAELELLGRSPITVTIVGPSGTGKTQMAQGIHAVSRRSTGPLLIENIGAMSESLAISELFGHERGAYTGAVHHRAGLLRTAHGGTLVLDELTKAPTAVQHALLNVIEGRPFRPSGSDRYLQVDVRIIAIASTPLEAAVRDRSLVPDLYERLRSTIVRVHPLSARQEDVLAVARTAIRKLSPEYGYGEPPRLSAALQQALADHYWPGNHRHVAGIIARILANARGASELIPAHAPADDVPEDDSAVKDRFFAGVAQKAPEACGGPTRAAAHYGKDRSTIRRWLKEASAKMVLE